MMVADTDVLIEYLRGRDPWAARIDIELGARLSTTVVSVFELWSGVRGRREEASLGALLAALHVLPLGEAEARDAATIRRELDAKGQGIGMADSLIAGICRARGATLLTCNRRHFERVAGLRLGRGGA
jgi:tRNA(fMet)-specific endonuclease VapC